MPITADAAPNWNLEIIAGRGQTFRNEWTTAGFADLVGAERPLAWGLGWSPMFTVGAIGGAKEFGPKDDKTVWFAGAGARLFIWKGFFASFEAGAVNTKTPAFSSTQQFATSAGWRWKYLVIEGRHISNGDTGGPNHGETMYMAGVSIPL